MNIVILHRIPFAKIRYDLAVDHDRHTVRYLSTTGTTDGLPAGADRRVLTTPTADVDALAAEHADWLGSADRLIARSEYDLLPAAHLRERFGIPGDRPADIAPLRDKWLMRTRAAAAGIAQPAFWSVADFRRNPPTTGTYLIKPRLEASSTGIETGDARQILDRLAAHPAASDTSDVFVEQFVPGQIWHLDGYLRHGVVRTVTSSVYVGDCLNFAHGSPLGSAQTPDEPEALALLRRTLPVLGQRDGAFHFELIRTGDGRFLFLETASRVGGAGVAETFELRTGVNLYQVDLAHQ
ncbi:acetyl-CoA carboxylase biotin carboxylase subunit family protein, partial [Parafrankia sp. EUN1f]|uniref:ATP-grasp domain-containing protein n=1 Tax=Parafrankia sp. EUN1f TaxID=102897 RepID=UPI0001C45363